ncbi:methyltransferase domain-containing protein [Candidatus Poribacteria bacterium]|nr:methyltransferase domain-containing protein [Candidatus Poribacteria bacterium]
MADIIHLVFYIRKARSKARQAAIMEVSCLFRDMGVFIPSGGPLSEKGQVFWVDIPQKHIDDAVDRMQRLGYTEAVDMLEPAEALANPRQRSRRQLVKWKRDYYKLVRLYEEDKRRIRKLAPDRRKFMLEICEGEVKFIRGYRGDGGLLSRRGLPVCDARLLTNLVFTPGENKNFLDPFAGVGGIILEAFPNNYRVFSTDSDDFLRHGLDHIADYHSVADAACLPFKPETFDAIATEPPYHEETDYLVKHALREMHRVAKPGCRISMLCIDWQGGILRHEADSLELTCYLDLPVNRKGVDCVVMAWEK